MRRYMIIAASLLLAPLTVAAPSHGGTPSGGPPPPDSILARSRQVVNPEPQALEAGESPPAFLMASVQPVRAPVEWRAIYSEVAHCAGLVGDFDLIRWGVMETPLNGPQGATYAFVLGNRIVLVRNDTTYLRHEMLHHILAVAGWHPPVLQAGEDYTVADLHPMPLFGLCTGDG